MNERIPPQSSREQESPETLDALRERINRINAALVRLIAERREVSERIAQEKLRRGLPVYQPEREAEVYGRLDELARDMGVDSKLVRAVFELIIRDSREVQQAMIETVIDSDPKTE